MIHCTTLRIDFASGAAILDYRIGDGCVEMRIRNNARSGLFEAWRRLTVDELIQHVQASPILSRWLQRRMGIRSMLRVCASRAY